jgi:hypothetical protein
MYQKQKEELTIDINVKMIEEGRGVYGEGPGREFDGNPGFPDD